MGGSTSIRRVNAGRSTADARCAAKDPRSSTAERIAKSTSRAARSPMPVSRGRAGTLKYRAAIEGTGRGWRGGGATPSYIGGGGGVGQKGPRPCPDRYYGPLF